VILDYHGVKAEGVEIIVPNNPNERYDAMRCGSPGIKTNMDMIRNPKEPPYWHK
jgi:hypothetical protein